jgi:NitT/TauT family transport system substrate-binding protein
MKTTKALAALLLGSALIAGSAAPSRAADPIKPDHIKDGIVTSMGGLPNFIGKEKGFFAEENIDTEIVFFDAAQPIAIAVASGDIDFGTTGLTAAFFNLAQQGSLRMLGSGTWEHPTFQSIGFLVSNGAYASGLHSLKDIAGRKAGITQSGTPLQYAIALAAKKYDIDYSKLQIVLLQSNPNVGTALTGNQVDFATQTVVPAYDVIKKGGAKLLGWQGDELPPQQNEMLFTSTKLVNDKAELLTRYMRAYRKSMAYLHDAFADANDKRRDGANADEVMNIAAKYLKQPVEQLKEGVPFFSTDGRIDEDNVATLMAWYKSQGMMKGDVAADALIDKRDAVMVTKK